MQGKKKKERRYKQTRGCDNRKHHIRKQNKMSEIKLFG